MIDILNFKEALNRNRKLKFVYNKFVAKSEFNSLTVLRYYYTASLIDFIMICA